MTEKVISEDAGQAQEAEVHGTGKIALMGKKMQKKARVQAIWDQETGMYLCVPKRTDEVKDEEKNEK